MSTAPATAESPAPFRFPTGFAVGLFLFIAVLFCAQNLPWHLDDFDQAKQAYTSFEMVKEGHWWFQHTPTGKIATKPPLAGWISAGLFRLMGPNSWPLAWRLPSLAAAAFVLWLMWRGGTRLQNHRSGGILACSAFALTVFTPRIASLVRTDMLLTATIVFAGYLVFERIRTESPWSAKDRWLLFSAVLASMLLKGPIVYAFLAPGLLAYWWLTKKLGFPNRSWSGFWPWLAPLLFFGAWAAIGISQSEEFKDQVVFKEFLGRFTTGENAVHKPQPVYFYVGLILVRWQPWSLILTGLLCCKSIRDQLRRNPSTLWLACWSIGGLLLMSVIPSKRFDRILPVIPPLCLLVVALMRGLPSQLKGFQTTNLLHCAIAFSALLSGGYAIKSAREGYSTNQAGLVHFGQHVAQTVSATGGNLAVVTGKDEGMLLYTDQPHFTHIDQAMALAAKGELQWLVIPEAEYKKRKASFPGFQTVTKTGQIPEKSSAYLFMRRKPDPSEPSDKSDSTSH